MDFAAQYTTTMCLRFLGCIHLVLALFNVQAQEVGVDICACQPAYYSMTLQFNLTCDDRTIHEDDIDGVEETQCLILPRGGIDVTDFVPVAVREIQVLEITREDVVIKSTVFDDGYSDGDSIEFESFLVTDPGAVNKLTLPKIISMTIIGENAAGQTLFHLLAISYDNSCDTFPVISAGARIGWIVFVRPLRLSFVNVTFLSLTYCCWLLSWGRLVYEILHGTLEYALL